MAPYSHKNQIMETIEIDEYTVLSRYLCPNLCQCLKYEGRKCEKCGEDLEYIGDMNEFDLDKELGKRQIAKLGL